MVKPSVDCIKMPSGQEGCLRIGNECSRVHQGCQHIIKWHAAGCSTKSCRGKLSQSSAIKFKPQHQLHLDVISTIELKSSCGARDKHNQSLGKVSSIHVDLYLSKQRCITQGGRSRTITSVCTLSRRGLVYNADLKGH